MAELPDLSAGESFTVEFKRHRNQNDLSRNELVENVVCLANGEGGTLVLGVEDDGTVTGYGPLPVDTAGMAAFILNRTQPGVPVDVTEHHIDGHTVVAVDVPDMDRIVGTKSGTYRRRSVQADGTPSCIPFLPEEMLSAGLFAARQDYATLPATGASWSDLSAVEFDRFRSMCRDARGDDVLANLEDMEICRALRVIDQATGRPTIGAILMFGTAPALDRWIPTAEVQFQVRTDDDSLTRNVAERLPLFAAFEWLVERVDAVNDETEVMVGLMRVGLRRIPDEVAREAVANALVHRDYTEMGSVRVTVAPTNVSVVSPGAFPRGVTLSNLLDTSVPRSPAIADAFRRAGLVDRAGRGISKMFRAQLLAGRDVPDYSRSGATAVTADIPTSTSDIDMVRFVVNYENGRARTLPLLEVRILHTLRHAGRLRVSEIEERVSSTSPAVSGALTRLVERGLVEQVGSGRTRAYTLGPAFYAAADDRNAYVRVRSTDPLQQKHMILQYVDAYGRITRGQVMTLCSVGVAQARSLLKQLIDNGDLTLVGERRAAHYIKRKA